MESLLEHLEEIEEELRTRAFLFDSPRAYAEAIDAAFEAIRAALERALEVA